MVDDLPVDIIVGQNRLGLAKEKLHAEKVWIDDGKWGGAARPRVSLPLNRQSNQHHPFHPPPAAINAAAKERARFLPTCHR